jgi:hypothetical protein
MLRFWVRSVLSQPLAIYRSDDDNILVRSPTGTLIWSTGGDMGLMGYMCDEFRRRSSRYTAYN